MPLHSSLGNSETRFHKERKKNKEAVVYIVVSMQQVKIEKMLNIFRAPTAHERSMAFITESQVLSGEFILLHA